MANLQQYTGKFLKNICFALLALLVVGAGSEEKENHSIPQNLRTAPRQLCVHLEWEPASGSMGYEIQRATSLTNRYETLPNILPQLTVYNDFVGTAATNLYYRVRSIQTNGAGATVPSDWSKPVAGYSDGLKASGIVWDADKINTWITNPRKVVPDTKMAFLGIGNDTVRANIIAYLQQATK